MPGQVLDRLELARRLLELLQRTALDIDRVNDALFQRGFQRTEGQVVLVIALKPQFRRVFHVGPNHLRIVIPVVRVGELHDLHIVHGHAVDPEHELDALMLLDAPPVVLDLVQAFRQSDLFAFQVDHPVDIVPGRAPSWRRLRGARASRPGAGSGGCQRERAMGGNKPPKRIMLSRLWM